MANQEPEAAIRVKNLTKTFRLPLGKGQSVKNRILGRVKQGHIEFTPLDSISFDVYKGDFFGIVGKNGSGKSTLLKTIAGIYQPTKGKVRVNGRLVPFIELGVGFNPELSGKDNVYLNMALLGFDRDETTDLYKDIVDFAELHDFMEERLVNYSSGMQVRLAFSIAIRAKGDILLLDEVLAVGDSAFQQKCYDYFEQLKKEKKTVILVTHNMANVDRFCNRAMLLDEGNISVIGNIDDVTRAYEEINLPTQEAIASTITGGVPGIGVGVETSIDNLKGRKSPYLTPEDEFIDLDINIYPKADIEDAFVGVAIKGVDNSHTFWTTTEGLSDGLTSFKGGQKKTIRLSVRNIFGEGRYVVHVSVKSSDRSKTFIMLNGAASFSIFGYKRNGWMLHPDHEFKDMSK